MNNLFVTESKQAPEIGGRETGLQGKVGTVRAPGSYFLRQPILHHQLAFERLFC